MTEVIIIKDSLLYNNEYIYLNEICLKADNQRIVSSFNNSIRSFSLNKLDKKYSPRERLKEKKIILKKSTSSNDLVNCSIVAENYCVLALTSQFLNIKYEYNRYGSYQSYEKYYLLNIIDGSIVTNKILFTNPDSLLSVFNQRYVYDLGQEIKRNKDEEELIDILNDHYVNRKEFTLTDLNNFELKINKKTTELEGVRIHYTGIGGYYNSVWPNGYIEFDKKYIKSDFIVNP